MYVLLLWVEHFRSQFISHLEPQKHKKSPLQWQILGLGNYSRLFQLFALYIYTTVFFLFFFSRLHNSFHHVDFMPRISLSVWIWMVCMTYRFSLFPRWNILNFTVASRNCISWMKMPSSALRIGTFSLNLYYPCCYQPGRWERTLWCHLVRGHKNLYPLVASRSPRSHLL